MSVSSGSAMSDGAASTGVAESPAAGALQGPPKILYGDALPTDADKYLTVDSPAKLVKTSNYWSVRDGAAHLCQYKRLVPCMSQLQKQLLDEHAEDAVELVDYDFDGGITMYPYNEKVQPHYDYFASTIKTKGDLESIR